MGFKFDPLLWFVCGNCRRAFQDTEKLKRHKLENHLGYCLKVKCIVFEERIIEQGLSFPADVVSADKSNTDIQIIEPRTSAKKNENNCTPKLISSPNNLPNPYVSLERLTAVRLDLFYASKNLKHESKRKKRSGSKRSSSPLSSVFPSSAKRGKLSEDNLNEGFTPPLSSSSISVPPSSLQNTDSAETEEVITPSNFPLTEIESREFIIASVTKNPDGSEKILFTETIFRAPPPEFFQANDSTTDSPVITNKETTMRIDESEAIAIKTEMDSFSLAEYNEIEESTVGTQVDETVDHNSDADFDDYNESGSPTVSESFIGVDCSKETLEADPESEPIQLQHQSVVNETDRDTRSTSANLKTIDDSNSSDNLCITNKNQTRTRNNNLSSIENRTKTTAVDKELSGINADLDIDLDNSTISTNPDLQPVTTEEPQPEAETSTSRYITRRKRSTVNYSESHLCKFCNKDLYVVEELEDHEKRCWLRNHKNASSHPSNSKTSPSKNNSHSKKNSLVVPSDLGSKNNPEIIIEDSIANNKKKSDDEEDIEVIKVALRTKSRSRKTKVVKDADSDYEKEALQDDCANVSESDSDSGSRSNSDDDFCLRSKRNSNSNSNSNSRSRRKYKDPNAPETKVRKPVEKLSLAQFRKLKEKVYPPLTEWLKLEREKIESGLSTNVILIENDPTLLSESSQSTSQKPLPIICKLCHLILDYPKETADFHIRIHLENCWFHNKGRHRYCVQCDHSFSDGKQFILHMKYDHATPEEEENHKLKIARNIQNKKSKHQTHQNSDEESKESSEDEDDHHNQNQNQDQDSDSASDVSEFEYKRNTLPLDLWLKKQMEKLKSREQLLVEENKPLPSRVIVLIPDPLKWGYDKVVPSAKNKNKVYCGLCGLKFLKEVKVKNHVQTCWRYNKSEHTYCIPCRKQCISIGGLNLHKFQEHTSGPKFPFFCEDCCTGFLSMEEFKDHKISRLAFRPDKIVYTGNTSDDKKLDVDVDIEEAEAESDRNCSNASKENDTASLVQWLKEQKKLDPSNKIIMDPNPLIQKSLPPISEANPIKCKLCMHSFTSLNVLKSHVSVCYRTNKRIHIFCIKCNQVLRHPKDMKEHNFRKHSKGPRTQFKCEICGKVYITTQHFEFHVKTHETEETTLKPFKCEVCGLLFRYKQILKIHLVSHQEERPCKCDKCPQTFKTELALQKHQRVHGKEFKNKCKFCGRSFSLKCQLQDHERTHTGEKPYKCEVEGCGSAFPSSSSLTMHRKIKHAKELGLEQFLCPSCGQVFGLQSHLNYHVRRFHTQAEDKPFKCEEKGCGRTFSIQHQLTEHRKVHSGEKPFQCEQCGLAFVGAQFLKNHKKKHEKEQEEEEGEDEGRKSKAATKSKKKKQFQCKYCTQEFSTKASLNSHEETHEEDTESGNSSSSDSD